MSYTVQVFTNTSLQTQVLEDEERNSSRQGGEDVQILRLDEDTRREETYRRLGDSEILSLDHNSMLTVATNHERAHNGGLANQVPGDEGASGSQNVVKADVEVDGEDKSLG